MSKDKRKKEELIWFNFIAYQPLSVIWCQTHFYTNKQYLFQTIHFRVRTQFCSILPIDRTLSVATTPGQSRHLNDDNIGVLNIPQSFSLTIGLFSVISRTLVGEVLLLCSDTVGVFCSASRLDQEEWKRKVYAYYDQVQYYIALLYIR